METKNHYRKVFKSDHLGSADLEEMVEEGKRLVFTIKEVKQEYGVKVAGKKIDANIAYFQENIMPLVLIATNSKQMAKFAKSKFVEDWSGITIELYIDASVRMKGEVVGGVRIKPTLPQSNKRDFTNDVQGCQSIPELQCIWREMTEDEQVRFNAMVTKWKVELQKSVA